MTRDELTLLIAIPLAVSIIANLLTPAVRTAVSRGATGTAKALKLLGTRGIRLRLRQLQQELELLERLTQDPRAITFYLGEQVLWQLFMLWLFVIAIGAVVVFGAVESEPYNAKVLIPGAFGAGGVQAFISSITTMNTLSRVKRPDEYHAKLVKQIAELESMLPPK